MQIPTYATREDVKNALDSKATARNDGQIDRALAAATDSINGLCHRTFYPQVGTRSWDWPTATGGRAWRLWLDDNELISLTSLTSGGRTIDLADVLLEPNASGPPYTRLELNLSGSSSLGGGPTRQRDITAVGLYGYRDDVTTVGTHTGLNGSATTLVVDAATSAAVGVGSLLRLGDERLIVTGRSMHDTGQTLAGAVDQQVKTLGIPVADGSQFAETETILVDTERMRIDEIAGNTLIVRRAWDGSANAPHEAGAHVYAPRALRVTRGAVGTTAAVHSAGSVLRWDPPSLVRQLAIAEAVTGQAFEASGGARMLRSGEGSSERTRDSGALQALRDATYTAHGRKARSRAV
ncbi:hypothetical protein STAN_1871 [Streptomyces sp. CBMAI 2042]|uniref:hypothetical protein n=1 Tax=Streptomyces sp. CBMAI 2042 TaxID=2305222 RepID=UPI000F11F873|nr:hypothetical protein [Streptomyces sp. CBMAI 2042]RLV66350.1 hypothetical protein STAN_1871 [Streptomyces sp. CBMAI 2042]